METRSVSDPTEIIFTAHPREEYFQAQIAQGNYTASVKKFVRSRFTSLISQVTSSDTLYKYQLERLFEPDDHLGRNTFQMENEALTAFNNSLILPKWSAYGYFHVTALLTALWFEENFLNPAQEMAKRRSFSYEQITRNFHYFTSDQHRMISLAVNKPDYERRLAVKTLMDGLVRPKNMNKISPEDRKSLKEYWLGVDLGWERWRALSTDA